MNYRRRPFARLKCSDDARNSARSNLRAAKNGNGEQYLALIAHYVDLSQTFFSCSFTTEPAEKRTARMIQLLKGLWQNLRYAERLSDFEFMLAQALIESSPEQDSAVPQEALTAKLGTLPPQTRFAILAHYCGNWPLRWVALAMRIKVPALHRLLCQARCELCDLSWESLAREERTCLEAISAALEQSPNIRTNQTLSKSTQAYPRVLKIKAQWLELRSDLVELRLRHAEDQASYQQLLTQTLTTTNENDMQRPPVMDRLLNSLHFSRHERIKVY
jgi:hypothetical protein